MIRNHTESEVKMENTPHAAKSPIEMNRTLIKREFAKYLRAKSEILKKNWEIENVIYTQNGNQSTRR